MREMRMEQLIELGRILGLSKDPQEVRRAALDWVMAQTGAVEGTVLLQESGAWRCAIVRGDPAFWEREWTLPPSVRSIWEPAADTVWFLPITEREPSERLGVRDPDPEALADEAGWEAAKLWIGMALEAAREREARGTFFSIAVHELRLPMTSIKGYADLLLKELAGPLTENQRRFLGTIRANIDRLATLVNDLLEHARLETGRLRLRIEPVSLSEALEEALRRVRSEIESRGHRLSVDLLEDLPQAAADRERLEGILGKVLDNAAKYTPPGGEIRVRAWRQGPAVICEVEDTGIGIAPPDQAQLFTPFWRSEDPRVREVPGFGLSLAVARGLLQAMGGEIEVEGAPGQGTRVRIRLPAAGSAC
ncbi:MAG: HAMP domain-containing histidine kinase [Thermoflexus sp.]|nr:HAMP domain-containing histidine kinase [Thermoflexus sp.]